MDYSYIHPRLDQHTKDLDDFKNLCHQLLKQTKYHSSRLHVSSHRKVFFIDPIVPSYTPETSFPSRSHISFLSNQDIPPISSCPLNLYDHSQ